jgi:biotin carboxyl carrier protein
VKARRRFRWGRPGGEPAELVVEIRDATRASVKTPDAELLADFARLPDGRQSVILPSGRQVTGRTTLRCEGRAETWVGARRLAIRLSDPLRELAGEGSRVNSVAAEVRAQIPGRVVEVRVRPGDRVSAGATLVVLEAMKMQNEIQAESDARVVAVECAAGQAVDTGAILVRLEPGPAG